MAGSEQTIHQSSETDSAGLQEQTQKSSCASPPQDPSRLLGQDSEVIGEISDDNSVCSLFSEDESSSCDDEGRADNVHEDHQPNSNAETELSEQRFTEQKESKEDFDRATSPSRSTQSSLGDSGDERLDDIDTTVTSAVVNPDDGATSDHDSSDVICISSSEEEEGREKTQKSSSYQPVTFSVSPISSKASKGKESHAGYPVGDRKSVV